MSFNRAILRKPGKEIINGLSQHASTNKPDFNTALEQHTRYAGTLKTLGLFPLVNEAVEAFPDGCFTEDTHLILPEVCIRLNPGAPSRAAEPDSLLPSLPTDRPLKRIPLPYTIDGGDILVSGNKILVGLSSRTMPEAVTELKNILAEFNYQVHPLPVPDGLHLKSGMTCIKPDIFIIQQIFEPVIQSLQSKLNQSFVYHVVPAEEDFAANLLPLNGNIIIPPGCPQTKNFVRLYYAEENIHEVDTSEFRKVDGALTCLSIPYKI